MKTDRDIEQLLRSGKNHTLSVADMASIKSALLSHATESLRHEQRPQPSLWQVWMMRSAVSFAAVLFVFVGTAYAAEDSLPGESLYAVKVHIVEEVIARTKLDPVDRAAYDVSLMEKRLSELQLLSETSEVPENADLAVVADQINEHVADVATVLETVPTDALSQQKKLETLSKISSITKAQTKLSEDHPHLTPVSDAVGVAEDAASSELAETASEFTAGQPKEVVNSYLDTQIGVVAAQVTATTTDADLRDLAKQHLTEANQSLDKGNSSDALVSLFEVQQEIGSEQYIDDRGGE